MTLTSPHPTPLSGYDRGTGRPLLLLHGGAGPRSVIPFADRLVEAGGTRVIVPTHPGFSGTERPATMQTPANLAERYLALLDELGLDDVTVVGFSMGGWVASEIAVRADPRVSRIVVVDGIGITVDGHPVADVSGLSQPEIAALSYHDPSLAPNPATLTDEQRAEFISNIAAVVSYSGDPTVNSGLSARLGEVGVPALVIWGESDGIADADYGRAYAAAYPHGRFELLKETGHMPQIEQPEALAAAILAFAS